jgi:predicted O-methyltransferase YrrM
MVPAPKPGNTMLKRVLKKLGGIYRRTSIQPYEKFRRLQHGVESFNPGNLKEIQDQLRPAYEQYVREISSPDMAASLELASVLFVLCRANGYQRIADLGSGFSSYTFRKYAGETSGVEVFSVDDDENWLIKTKQFLSLHQLDTAHVMTLQQFNSGGHLDFDCILHDLNFVIERIKHVEELLTRVKPGGLIIFDDVHKPHYLTDLLEILSRHKGSIYSLRPATTDRFGRYSLAYLRLK